MDDIKVFQIVNDMCHWHARQYGTAAETEGLYPPDCLFVDAPDEVHEGWGYLDGEFIKPTPPEGFLYDDATGTFYAENGFPPSTEPTMEERIVALEDALMQLVYEKMTGGDA